MNTQTFSSIMSGWLESTGLKIGIIILVTVILLLLVRLASRRALARIRNERIDREKRQRAKALNSVLRYVLNFIILSIAVVMVLEKLGIQIGPILATAGVVGIAIGFGAQRLIQDIISGFFILMEDQIREGDYVEIAGKSGRVERVSLNMTVIRDISGNVHFIRNGQIDTVTNMTHGHSCYLLDVGIAYKEDVDRVIEIIKKVDEEIRSDPAYKDDICEPIKVFGLDRFTDSAVVIRARIKTRPVMQWKIGREFNRRLKRKFDQEGIEIPFPHLKVCFSENAIGRRMNTSTMEGS
jgi:small-conductance mechanosensitive channel